MALTPGPISSLFPGSQGSRANGLSPASQMFGGSSLQQQLEDETQRKKRLQMQQQQGNYSPATMSLLNMGLT
jgi:hypothetical protein